MKLSSINASNVSGTLRFDAKYHLATLNPLLQDLNSGRWKFATIAETFGRENVWAGNIFSRVYASSPDYGKPLLVPYDLFRYLPWSDKILSRSQVDQFDRLEIKRGCLFIVCSGRNLGPVTIADSFCTQFTMSHDMVRIEVEPCEDLFFLAAFLSTAHGQAAIRTDMNGSVIDHTDANQVAALRFPLVDGGLKSGVAALFKSAFEKRERARLLLAKTQAAYLAHFNLGASLKSRRIRRFSTRVSELVGRIDAEPKAPFYAELRRQIEASGGCELSQIADVVRPASRYKTNYVQDAQYGLPMMNGRQIAQYKAIGLQYMSMTSFKEPEQFVVREGMTLLTADGRAEENLADCVLVESNRDGWGASGHVHRVVPKSGINAGLVYLACSSAPVQAQLKALATGSVVDGLGESDVASVFVPYEQSDSCLALGKAAETAWGLFGEAALEESTAANRLESELGSA
jgi:hypothetical protein